MAEPVAEAAAVTTAAAAAVDGEAIYKQSCMACHAAGVAGAPKLGDSQAWSPRIAKGNEALVQSVTNGLNAMPPKGGCMNCSDDELRGAVDYMVSQGS
jgi:cytochrome c5